MISKIAAICFLTFTLSAGAAAADKGKIPSEQELKALTLNSLIAFNSAVAAKDFTAFLGQASELWQGQATPRKLAEIFNSFIEQQVDIAFISKSDPTFDKPPAIDRDGVLTLEGHYPTKPSKVDFALKYIYEKPGWKLVGIKLDVAPTLPSEKETQTLVQDSLGNFNQAVLKKDFTDFYGQISILWQKQITPTQLQQLFQSFIDAKIDLTPVVNLEPVFDEPPAISEERVLSAKGRLPSKSEKVHFEFGYVFESSAWKLMKVNVQVSPAGEEEKKQE